MKIGMNMLLWTGHVTAEHLPHMAAIKATGFDGVEIPVFDPSEVAHFAALGAMLDDLGLERTAVALIPDEAHNPLTGDPAAAGRALDHLKRVAECCAAMGATHLVGPFYQPLGVFTGEKPTGAELDRCAALHRDFAPFARGAGLTLALEPLNRFEAYLINTIEQGINYCELLGEDGFGILYDTFHQHIEEKDPLAALDDVLASPFLNHVHISENDRGTPGAGHAKIRETIARLKASDYDGWLTIEAFGRAVPELAAATKVWRDLFADPADVYRGGYAYIRDCLSA